GLLVVPGLIALQALRVEAIAVGRVPLLVPAASLLALLVTSLGVDLIGPLVGVAQPLRATPLLVGLDVVLALSLAAARSAPSLVADLAGLGTVRVRALWPLVLPVVAAVGAQRLDNGQGSAVAVTGAAALVIILLVSGVVAHRLSPLQIGLILYGVSLASIVAFTLRSNYQFGYDVMGEYQVMQQTATAGVWHTHHVKDAFGAMLSLTTLPALFHSLVGVAAVEVMKWIYPLVFAFFPLVVYGIGRRLLLARAAFLAAAFVAVQTYFFHQMPQISRQEVGLLFFAALAGTLLERSIVPRTKLILVSLLGVAMAVTHYSTTYVAILILGLAVALRLVIAPWSRMRLFDTTTVVALLVTTSAAVVWNFPITRSADNVTSFLNNVERNGFNLLPGAKPGESLVDSYLKGNRESAESASAFQAEVADYYQRNRGYLVILPEANDPRYDLVDAHPPRKPTRSILVQRATDVVNLLVQQMSNVIGGLGALGLLVANVRSRRRAKRAPDTVERPRGMLLPERGRRRLDRWAEVGPPLQLAILATAALAVVAVIRLSGTAAYAYNQERLYLQAMVFLAVPLAYAVEILARRVRPLMPVVFGGYLALLSVAYATGLGVTYAANGGGAVPNVANSGAEYDDYYLTEPEVAAARYLTSVVPRQDVVYTDHYGQLRLIAFTNIVEGVFTDITPLTLDQHAWVYATATNIARGRAVGKINGHAATYAFPNAFLDDEYDTIYSAGTSKVYHR
ncbi:MAG: hypothetical protein QOD72_3237, partial [Acidimicrobiaceae bacterium]|nr:hypothetical protein [Acidimicrobiaceae bacterium]